MTDPARDPVDLSALVDVAGDGVHWTLEGSSDLNANLVRLEPGHSIGEHRNDAVDVVLLVIAGGGTVRLDGVEHAVGPHTLLSIPKGVARRIAAGDEPPGLAYLTVHRRRGLLTIGGAADLCELGGEGPCLAPFLDDDGKVPPT